MIVEAIKAENEQRIHGAGKKSTPCHQHAVGIKSGSRVCSLFSVLHFSNYD